MTKTKPTRNVQLPKEQTRKHLSRIEREAKQNRIVLLVIGGVIAVILVIVGYGVLRQTVLLQNEPVALVQSEPILTRDFQNRVRLIRSQLIQQINIALQNGDQNTASSYQSELANASSLGNQVLTQMTDELLLRQGAASFGVTVSPEEVQTRIEEDFGYFKNPPTPAPTRTPRPTPTVTEPITQTPTPTATPLPTATPFTKEAFDKLYADQLTQWSSLGFSEQDFRNWIEMQIYTDKVNQAIAATVPTTTLQVKFRYVRVGLGDVPTVTQSLKTDGFAKLYDAIYSNTYPITTVVASSFSWLPMDEISRTTEFGPQIAQAVFNEPIGQVTEPITNTDGTALYIAEIQAREVQPISPSFLQQRQQDAQQAWLQQRHGEVTYLTWDDRVPTKP
jgi:hypothetical protein